MESAEKSEIKLAEELKALKSNNRGSTDANFKIAELLERLMETEKSERALKEQGWTDVIHLPECYNYYSLGRQVVRKVL